jgi:hypothetical protein
MKTRNPNRVIFDRNRFAAAMRASQIGMHQGVNEYKLQAFIDKFTTFSAKEQEKLMRQTLFKDWSVKSAWDSFSS